MGYTVIELLAVLAIASSLLLVAIPLFQTQVQNSRMSAATTDLLSTFVHARAEAIGRRHTVRVCVRNANGTGCATTGGWEQGWLTFVDFNGNGVVDAAVLDPDGIEAESGDIIIQVRPPLSAGMTARGTGNLLRGVSFRPNGLTDLNATESLIICDERKPEDHSRLIVVSLLGKASALRPSPPPGTPPGAPFTVDCLPT